MKIFGIQIGGGQTISADRSPVDDFWYQPLSAPVAAGVAVDPDRALQHTVVYACLKVLSETIAGLPFAMFERSENGDRTRRDQHPVAVLFANPNPDMTSFEFFGQMIWDLAGRGNTFWEAVPGEMGTPSALLHLDARFMTVERVSDGSIRYRHSVPGSAERFLSADDVWHLKVTPLIDGIVGLSPVYANRETIGAGLALQDYSARFFSNNATPPFIIKHPGNFKDADSKKNFLAAIKRWWGGSNRHSPAVLEYGMDITKIGVNNEEAQFLETRQELDKNIARIWRMPPHKVGIMADATFSNIEQQSLEFVSDCLMPWLRLVELSVAKNLILNPQRFFFEFNVAGLLRADLKSRYEAYAIGRNWGWLSVNEIRRKENSNPIGPEGDIYLQPLNMQEAGSPDRTAPAPAPPRRANGADHTLVN